MLQRRKKGKKTIGLKTMTRLGKKLPGYSDKLDNKTLANYNWVMV